MNLGELIKNYREENNISLRDFSKRTNLSHSYISMLEKNKNYRTGKRLSPSLDVVRQIALAMNMDIDDVLKILDDDQPITIPATPKDKIDNIFIIPILGRVPAGEPLLADENIVGYLPLSPTLVHQSNVNGLFFLKVQGDSMNKEYKNGSYVLVRQQDTAENGDNVVAIVNGDDEVTLKKFSRIDDQFVMLEPNSSFDEYEKRIINLKDTNFRILGKVIGNLSIDL